MRAINNYILVEEVNRQEKTESGILLSGADKENFRYKFGRVLNVGEEVGQVVSKDDEIFFDKSRSFKMMHDGKQITVIRLPDVIGVL
jgi:co-chaperonin GroES (HSP10)